VIDDLPKIHFLDDEGNRQVRGFVTYLQDPTFRTQLVIQLSVETPMGFDLAKPNAAEDLMQQVSRSLTQGSIAQAAPSLQLLVDLYHKFNDGDNTVFTIPPEFLPNREVLATCMAEYHKYVAKCVDSNKLPNAR
jgi:hypothetical protein